jgi:hypothetical protein
MAGVFSRKRDTEKVRCFTASMASCSAIDGILVRFNFQNRSSSSETLNGVGEGFARRHFDVFPVMKRLHQAENRCLFGDQAQRSRWRLFPSHHTNSSFLPGPLSNSRAIDSKLVKSVNSRNPGSISTNMVLTFSKQEFSFPGSQRAEQKLTVITRLEVSTSA